MTTADSGTEDHSRDRPARTIVRRLIDSRGFAEAEGDTSARAAAGDYLYRELSRWVGSDGCHALFTRALGEARTEYPPLGQINLRVGSEPYVGGVAETVVAYGDTATSKALESMLVRLVELLGRLIGDDMAAKLIDRSSFASERANLTSHGKREKA
ncbi:MAG: hypothetical protein QOH22_1243 [Gemmatimonadaceae bacterium]|jgi:hypothetical protein|nr:hypothetical protein [Gemmatimonadaceae bacterium]